MDASHFAAFDPAALFDLSGRVALVTGPGRGLGRASALALAHAGADIAGLYRQTVEQVQGEVEALGRRFLPIQLDLETAAPDALRGAVVQTADSLGQLDILVNNAGMIRRSPAIDYRVEDWDDTLRVNLSAAFHLSQAAARVMRQQPLRNGYRGKIIQVASLLSYQGGILVPGYAATKHGLLGITRAFANEWAVEGIHVNAIAPGYMVTDVTEALRTDPNRSQALLARIPAGRWGEPADLAGVVLFLASAASNYVHGTAITVDGGWMAR